MKEVRENARKQITSDFGFTSYWLRNGHETSLNPLNSNSDENEISLYINTTSSNNQVMRI